MPSHQHREQIFKHSKSVTGLPRGTLGRGTRSLRLRRRNALRAHLSEFGVVAPIGRNGIEQLLLVVNDENDARTSDEIVCVTAVVSGGERCCACRHRPRHEVVGKAVRCYTRPRQAQDPEYHSRLLQRSDRSR